MSYGYRLLVSFWKTIHPVWPFKFPFHGNRNLYWIGLGVYTMKPIQLTTKPWYCHCLVFARFVCGLVCSIAHNWQLRLDVLSFSNKIDCISIFLYDLNLAFLMTRDILLILAYLYILTDPCSRGCSKITSVINSVR